MWYLETYGSSLLLPHPRHFIGRGCDSRREGWSRHRPDGGVDSLSTETSAVVMLDRDYGFPLCENRTRENLPSKKSLVLQITQTEFDVSLVPLGRSRLTTPFNSSVPITEKETTISVVHGLYSGFRVRTEVRKEQDPSPK